MTGMPKLRKPEPDAPEPIRSKDALFWLAIRQALIGIVAAIERRHLPDMKKSARQS